MALKTKYIYFEKSAVATLRKVIRSGCENLLRKKFISRPSIYGMVRWLASSLA